MEGAVIDLRDFLDKGHQPRPHCDEVTSTGNGWLLACDGHVLVAVRREAFTAKCHEPWIADALRRRTHDDVFDTFRSLRRRLRAYRVPSADLRRWAEKGTWDMDPQRFGSLAVNRALVRRVMAALPDGTVEVGVAGAHDGVTFLGGDATCFAVVMPWGNLDDCGREPFDLAPYFSAAAAGFE